ncbi:MAG TPA: hypothetical protein VGN59_18860 [Acidimicrobiia bacterium]
MTAAHPFRPSPTRLAMLLAAGVLGVVLAAPGASAAPDPGPTAPPATVRPSATTTSTSTTSSTSSTSTTSTSSTSTTSTSTTSTTLAPVVLGPASVLTAPNPLPVAPRTTTPPRSTVRSGSGAGGTTGAELPFTGGGTTLVLVSGLAALAMGALAVWWGSRKSSELEHPEPGATG